MSEVHADHPHVSPWVVAIAVMSATFMEVLDTTIVNVSLPHIAGSLSASIDESTWALTSYLVANAIVLPMTGWLASQFGRKRLLLTAVTGFTLSSLLCGMATSLSALVMFRIMQGLTGGALQPLSQAVMLESFPPEKRGKAMAFWGFGIVVAPILGPVLGGWLTDSYSWRWVFYVNLPIGIVSVIMIRRFLFDPPYLKRASSKIDYWGIGLLAVGIGALQIVLDKGQEEDWFSSTWITALLIVSIVSLVIFVIWELGEEHPVVDLRVFKIRTYSTGVFLITTLGFVLYGSTVLLPVMLQTVLGYSSFDAGVTMAPRGMGSFLFMPIVGLLVGRVDPRRLLAIGLSVTAGTMIWLSFISLSVGYWDIFWPQFIQGMGMPFIFVPLTTITMDPIPRERMGNATSLFSLMRNIGGSIGIAVVATMLSRQQQAHVNVLGGHVDPYNPAAQALFARVRGALLAGGADIYTATQGAYAALFGTVMRQSSMLAFVEVFQVLGVLFLGALPLILLMRRPARASGGPGSAAH